MIYPWLEPTWQQIVSMRAQNRLPHALMLVGADAFGIEELAHSLAQAILCEVGGEKACGRCRNCIFFLANSHPDYFHVKPGDTGVIKIDVLRELSQKLTQKAARGGYQVVFLEQADCMQAAAANSILKTLEEPEGDVLFILWVKRAEVLPATIRSRTQQISCHGGSIQTMQTWLNEQLQLSTAKLWLKIVNNRPLAVKGLIDDGYLTTRDELIRLLQAVKEKRQSALDAADKFIDWSRATYFKALLSIAADGLRYCLGLNCLHWINEDQVEAIQRLFTQLKAQQAQLFYDCVQRFWYYEQLPQALNKSLLDCQIWLEWEKLGDIYYAD